MKNKLTVAVDYRIISVVLLIIILAMVAVWRPWQADASVSRKITVTGSGKVTAAPDSYQFNLTFQKPTTAELNSVVNAAVDKLKELGVEEKDIQIQSSAYQNPSGATEIAPRYPETDQSYAYLTVKVRSKELAQKVQDYISTSGATGQLTPYPTFSEEKQKQLREEARDKAIMDAKSQADKTAKNLETKLGKVLEVSDEDRGFGIMPYESTTASDDKRSSSTSIPVSPGEQDITFTVKAVFEIK